MEGFAVQGMYTHTSLSLRSCERTGLCGVGHGFVQHVNANVAWHSLLNTTESRGPTWLGSENTGQPYLLL